MSEGLEVYCVFEGGGAKGVAHVGYLSALDEHSDYNVVGYAGTSAGAIVAALAAAGWKGNELFELDEAGQANSEAMSLLSQEYETEFTSLADLLEPSDWRWLKWIRRVISRANEQPSENTKKVLTDTVRRYCRVLQVAVLAVVAAGLLLLLLRMSWIAALLTILAGGLVFIFLSLFSYVFGRYRGIASMDRPEEILEHLLSTKLGTTKGSPISFRELHSKTGKSLKVVAANIESGALTLFSPETTPDTSVSKAVTASAAIPFLFKSVGVDGRQHCDGGIVSNMPAWVFDEETLFNPNRLTVTCEISPPDPEHISRPDLRGIRLFSRVGITATFGHAALNTRGILRRLPLSAWASFNMLDFDKVADHIQLMSASKEQASIKMDLERLHRTGIDDVFHRCREISGHFGCGGDGVRVSYVREVTQLGRRAIGYHLWNCRGFDKCADKGLLLPKEGSLIGRTMLQEEPQLYDLTNPSVRKEYLGVGDGAFEHVLPDDRAWVAVVPLLEQTRRSRVSVAVCVDGYTPIAGDKKQFLSEVSDLINSRV